MIKIIKGNILNATEDIIAHQVNCRGVMGSGLAKQIRNKYPTVYDEYKRQCEGFKDKPSMLLGMCQLVEVENKIIANLFGQENYGRGGRYTDYEELYISLYKLKYYAMRSQYSIALPHGIGCGLAGGKWRRVHLALTRIFDDYPVTLYLLN